MLICICTSANTADSVAGQKLVEVLNNNSYFSRLKKILGDNAYRAVGTDFNIGVTVEATEREEGQKGFVPEAFRWVVERTFAWLNRQRRLVRNYEKRLVHQQSMNYIANTRLCLKRYEKWLNN